jgi:hypothetical protein
MCSVQFKAVVIWTHINGMRRAVYNVIAALFQFVVVSGHNAGWLKPC